MQTIEGNLLETPIRTDHADFHHFKSLHSIQLADDRPQALVAHLHLPILTLYQAKWQTTELSLAASKIALTILRDQRAGYATLFSLY